MNENLTVYLKNRLPKIKERGYVINFDEYKSVGTHWIALNVNEHILIVLELNTFHKRLKNLNVKKLSQQIFIE